MGREGSGVRAISGTTIELTFSYKGQRCRERLKLEPTTANLKKAEDFLGAVRTSIAHGTFEYRVSFPNSKLAQKFDAREGDAMTVKVYLVKWLDMKKPTLKASTFEGYQSVIDTHLIPSFGNCALSDLKRATFREWAARQTFSNKRMKNILSVMRSALTMALDDEIVAVNVLSDWGYERNEAPRSVDDVDPFSAEEQAALLDACVSPQERNLFQFAIWTGLRTSELIGLRWQDIDWMRGVARVRHAVTRAARKANVVESTKTAGSTRNVKLLAPAMESLKAQKLHTYLLNDAVFHNPRTGTAWHNDKSIHVAWNRVIHKAMVDETKIRYRRPYQTRHTYASMMLSAGEPLMWVANQMGHTSLKMLEQRYGRWIRDAAPEAGGKAVEMFGGWTEKAGKKAVI